MAIPSYPARDRSVRGRLSDRLLAGRTELRRLTRSRPELRLAELLHRVETALAELREESWGTCSVCHEPISTSGMVYEHPLDSICLECMTQQQRSALERDLESAGRVQRTLLPPTHVQHDGWEMEYLWEPFGIVSGDHVDLVRSGSPTGPMHLLLGDVAGKGVAASLLQSQLHALFRALSPMEASLSELLRRANELFFQATAPSSFATLMALRLYPDGKVIVTNAGHPRPLLVNGNGVRSIEDATIPLGVVGDVPFSEQEIWVRPGETLLLYTDGWTEARRGAEEYGEGRVKATLRCASKLSVGELLASCRNDLADFLRDAALTDDLTIVAVRRMSADSTGRQSGS